jgi:hypothetical protein
MLLELKLPLKSPTILPKKSPTLKIKINIIPVQRGPKPVGFYDIKLGNKVKVMKTSTVIQTQYGLVNLKALRSLLK